MNRDIFLVIESAERWIELLDTAIYFAGDDVVVSRADADRAIRGYVVALVWDSGRVASVFDRVRSSFASVSPGPAGYELVDDRPRFFASAHHALLELVRSISSALSAKGMTVETVKNWDMKFVRSLLRQYRSVDALASDSELRARLELERVKLLPKQSRGPGGRPKNTERTSDDIVLAALKAHHKYQSETFSVLNPVPITNRQLAELTKQKDKAGLAPNALTRFLKRHDGMKEYRKSCMNDTLGMKLALWGSDFDSKRLAALRSGNEE